MRKDHNEFFSAFCERKEKLIEKKKQRKKILLLSASLVLCLSVTAVFPWDIFNSPDIKIAGEDGEGGGKTEQAVENTSSFVSSEGTTSELKDDNDAGEAIPPSYGDGENGEKDENDDEVPEYIEGVTPEFSQGDESQSSPSVDCEPDISGTDFNNIATENETATSIGSEEELETGLFPELGEGTRDEIGIEIPENKISGFMVIEDAAGNTLRYAELSDHKAFVEYLYGWGLELAFGRYPIEDDGEYPSPEDLPDTTAEETFYTVDEDIYEEDSIIEVLSEELESRIEIESETEDYGEGTLSSETSISSRERVIWIEIACDEEKWVFITEREEYEILYYKLEELLLTYEVKE